MKFTRNTQRNLRVIGYLLLDLGAGLMLGTALALSAFVYVLDWAARSM